MTSLSFKQPYAQSMVLIFHSKPYHRSIIINNEERMPLLRRKHSLFLCMLSTVTLLWTWKSIFLFFGVSFQNFICHVNIFSRYRICTKKYWHLFLKQNWTIEDVYQVDYFVQADHFTKEPPSAWRIMHRASINRQSISHFVLNILFVALLRPLSNKTFDTLQGAPQIKVSIFELPRYSYTSKNTKFTCFFQESVVA